MLANGRHRHQRHCASHGAWQSSAGALVQPNPRKTNPRPRQGQREGIGARFANPLQAETQSKKLSIRERARPSTIFGRLALRSIPGGRPGEGKLSARRRAPPAHGKIVALVLGQSAAVFSYEIVGRLIELTPQMLIFIQFPGITFSNNSPVAVLDQATAF
jgi:hypothetical protein